jgi:hypothetical protein
MKKTMDYHAQLIVFPVRYLSGLVRCCPLLSEKKGKTKNSLSLPSEN